MGECPFCERQMLTAASCTKSAVVVNGDVYDAVRYGEEDEWESNGRCHDCGVKEGGTHHPGCDVERIPPDAMEDHEIEGSDQMLWHMLGDDDEEPTIEHIRTEEVDD